VIEEGEAEDRIARAQGLERAQTAVAIGAIPTGERESDEIETRACGSTICGSGATRVRCGLMMRCSDGGRPSGLAQRNAQAALYAHGEAEVNARGRDGRWSPTLRR